ncbi:hypothetical protein ABEB36_003028 [Hypothenemus hampei]|uniref:DUF4817 domain-containing protein n=1 Tax=Hypothenemus hampei TaxID=57062 RepID=A0ABD1F7S6_HYPHA
MYSKEEKIEMLHLYQSGNNFRNVRDLFAAKYPEKPIPAIVTIHFIVKSFNSEGCVVHSHKKRLKILHVLTEEMKLNILCFVEENHIVSLKQVAEYFVISKSSVRKTLKEFKYKAYKFSNHQLLDEEDKIRRIDFCERVQNLLNENGDILEKICFSDEASFSLNGCVNSQNYRYWSNINAHVQNLPHIQYNAKVNVWIGIIGNVLIGPFFIEGNLNAIKFLDLLRNQIFPEIANLNIENPWFQMDGAPPHSTYAVRDLLNQEFPDRWMGRFGPILCAPRSPDLSPNDFFLWGYLKSKIYNNIQIQNVEELKQRICNACNEINPVFLRNSVRKFENCLAYCLEQEGGHFEYLL